MAGSGMVSHSAEESGILRSGAFILNLSGFSVGVNGRDVPVTRVEFFLLVALIRNPYNVLDRDTLLAFVTNAEDGKIALPQSRRAVDTHIARLRRKLGEAGYDCIKTMRHVGYRFVPKNDHETPK